jgi:glycosyltransferase involved in cell wall biosynthesis
MPVQKICILSPDDYAMLSGEPSFGPIGGEAVQHLLLARAWRDLGLEVSIIVRQHGQPSVTEVEGIRVVAACRSGGGIPGIRFLQKILSIVRAMKAIDADVYYQSPSGVLTGVVAWFAKRHGKCSIVRIASDLSCIRGMQLMRGRGERAMYEYGLRNASLVAAQTQHQQELLQRNYGLESAVVNMLVEIPQRDQERERDIDVLWVGNLRPVKRPELLFELARRLPQFKFAMVGAPLPHQQDYFDRISNEARTLPNVSMLGSVRYADVGTLFERAKIHVNTSSAEGFPNTFLQAWARRVPVVSFFDPDGLIKRRDLGRGCSDLGEMANAVEALLGDPTRRSDIGERARAFVAQEFSSQRVAAAYLKLAASAMVVDGRSEAELALKRRGS